MPREIEGKAPKQASGLTNSMTNVLGLLIPLVIFFGVTPYLLRGLGADGFGLVTLFMAAVAFASSLDFGLGSSGLRILGEAYHQGGRAAFRTAFRECWSGYFILSCGVLLLILSISVTWFWFFGGTTLLHHEGGWLVLCFAVALVATFGVTACQLVSRALESYFGMMVIQITTGVALWLGAVLLVYWGATVDLVVAWIAFAYCCSFFFHGVWCRRLMGGGNWWPVFRFDKLSETKSYGFFAFLAQMAGSMTYHGDKFIVSALLGAASTGYYGIATSLSSKLLMLIATMAGFIFPRAVRQFATEDRAGLRMTYVKASRYVLLTAWPMFVVAFIFAGVFSRLWLEEDVAKLVVSPLRLLLVAYFINGMSVVAANVLNGMGDSQTGAKFSAIGASVNLLTCGFLISAIGLPGAALAALAGSSQVFVFLLVLHRRLEIPDWYFLKFWGQLVIVGVGQSALGIWLAGKVVGWWSLIGLGFLVWSLFYLVWFGLPFAEPMERALVKRFRAGICALLMHLK